jgi:hypothetical protein
MHFMATNNGRGEQGRCGKTNGDLIGARAAVVRRHNCRGRRRWKELVSRALVSGRELESEEERCAAGRG